ncbi:MAG: exodeoxyribonuclease V subunit alpha [Syntrophobacteraceae bacterium]|jgi:exodeoxyribonuclease V alpha subunit|nr:exodeoxyribonuclease V subunit alpha [Syntrophobacteraceae bacterium]
MMEDLLKVLGAAGRLSPLDLHFAGLMARLDGSGAPEVPLAAALASNATSQGHVCLDLRSARKGLREIPTDGLAVPEEDQWLERLARSPVVGPPGQYAPLVLDDSGRIYLYRYWAYQRKLAEALGARMEKAPEVHDPEALRSRLDRLFPVAGRDIDWQRIAALASVRKTLCVVSGGPGTGKTTTVARILALLLETAPSGRLRMALAAPTGKAAARLQEAIRGARAALHCPEEIQSALPDTASTLHRLLGSITGSHRFRHDEDNPLPLDVLVVDEASMVDLPLMSRTVQALPHRARLILLGDRDQLASVEAGAVLGDLCGTGGRIIYSREFAADCEKACGMSLDEGLVVRGARDKARDCIIELRKSYRFSGEGGIARFSARVRQNDAGGALAILEAGGDSDLAWDEASSDSAWTKAVRSRLIRGFRDYLQAVQSLVEHAEGDFDDGLRRVFGCFEKFRVLCALREGPRGVAGLNALAEDVLVEEGLLERGRGWYAGRPVMIQRNDYGLHLFNGDIGITLPGIRAGSEHRVFFAGPEGTFRSFHPHRLPEHESVWAMTVHKSQGSEFDEVLLVLPERDAPVLTRELVYTAITRARKRVAITGTGPVLRQAILRSTERLSGLSDALWTAPADSNRQVDFQTGSR